jgi:chloramphenicol 3-O phosphotransferase
VAGPRLIVLNGSSSAGKTGLARCLQFLLPDPWLTFSIDSLLDAMPRSLHNTAAGIDITPDGQVAIGAGFRTLEAAWMHGIAAMARAGARIIVDDVFLSGARSQQHWLDALGDLPTFWVGVHCEPSVAAGREIARGNRVPGQAASQAPVVHVGVRYDLEVDTTHTESIECARIIAAEIG